MVSQIVLEECIAKSVEYPFNVLHFCSKNDSNRESMIKMVADKLAGRLIVSAPVHVENFVQSPCPFLCNQITVIKAVLLNNILSHPVNLHISQFNITHETLIILSHACTCADIEKHLQTN